MRANEFVFENKDITYNIVSPSQLNNMELNNIAKLIASGQEVSMDMVSRNLINASSIAYAKDNNKIVGAIVLKNPVPQYRNKVFNNANVGELENKYKLEIGYTYVMPEYRTKGVGVNLCRKMVNSITTPMYATTREENTTINKLLQFAGFKQTGDMYNSDRGDYNLLLWTKDSSNIEEAVMNPTSFANAIKTGVEKNVLVGFEFEVCVPDEILEQNTVEKDYLKIIKHLFKSSISFSNWAFDDQQNWVDAYIPVEVFDKYLVVKPNIGKYTNFKKLLAKTKSKNFDDWSDLVEVMFKGTRSSNIESNITNYFDIPDPKGLYDLLDELDIYALEYYGEDEDDIASYSKIANIVKKNIEDTMGAKVVVFDQYHQQKKDFSYWYIEPDTSIEPDDDETALEIVTPPLPANIAMEALDRFYALSKQLGFRTSSSSNTGLHVNVSIPNKIDVLKLAVFLGDDYLLKQYGREEYEYVEGVIQQLSTMEYDAAYKTKTKKSKILPGKQLSQTRFDKRAINSLAKYATKDHYASINYNGKYVSFRHPGGNYLGEYTDIKNDLGRFIRAVIIASDENAYRNEYLKKLTQLFGLPSSPTPKTSQMSTIRRLISDIKQNGLPALQIDMASLIGKKPIPENVVKDLIFDNMLGYSHKHLLDTNNIYDIGNRRTKQVFTSATYKALPTDMFASAIVIPKLYGPEILDSYEAFNNGRFSNINAPIQRRYVENYGDMAIKPTSVRLPITNDITKQVVAKLIETAKQVKMNEDINQPLYYFAYGMLTNPDVMHDSKFIGVSQLNNYNLKLYYYANIEPGTGSVYGSLWQIDNNILKRLDQIEGYPTLYERKMVTVTSDGKQYDALVYYMTDQTLYQIEGSVPTDEYVETILQGYESAGIPLKQLNDAYQESMDNSYNEYDDRD